MDKFIKQVNNIAEILAGISGQLTWEDNEAILTHAKDELAQLQADLVTTSSDLSSDKEG